MKSKKRVEQSLIGTTQRVCLQERSESVPGMRVMRHKGE